MTRSVGEAQQLKLRPPQRVLSGVNTMIPSKEARLHASSRRFVKVAPPTAHAGVGNALRHAFAMDVEFRSLTIFEELLARLDR